MLFRNIHLTRNVVFARHGIFYPRQKGYVFCLVGWSDYLKSNERICIKLSPEVCFGPKNNGLIFGDDLFYDPDTGSGLRSGSHGLVAKYCFDLCHDFDIPVYFMTS